MMASLSEFDALEEEVKELLQYYKHKKATAFEPCTLQNIKECLIGLHEELSLFNINYIFNPHLDMDNGTLNSESLVKLINSVWALLQYHKTSTDKVERLAEQNHILDHNNKQLNAIVTTLKEKVNSEKNEAKACVARTYTPCTDMCDSTLMQVKERERKQRQVIAKLQANNQELIREVLALKEEIILGHLTEYKG